MLRPTTSLDASSWRRRFVRSASKTTTMLPVETIRACSQPRDGMGHGNKLWDVHSRRQNIIIHSMGVRRRQDKDTCCDCSLDPHTHITYDIRTTTAASTKAACMYDFFFAYRVCRTSRFFAHYYCRQALHTTLHDTKSASVSTRKQRKRLHLSFSPLPPPPTPSLT